MPKTTKAAPPAETPTRASSRSKAAAKHANDAPPADRFLTDQRALLVGPSRQIADPAAVALAAMG